MENKRYGISAKYASIAMAAIALVISALLIFATYRATQGYTQMRAATDEYIQWERNAFDLQVGSDYLTEQVRCFAETGKRQYLDNYFEEANETRHRDSAVASIHAFTGESPAYQALELAMGESVALMEREYYSMRLKAEACGYDLAGYPEPVRQAALSPQDAALSAGEKDVLARSMVFDDIYHGKKEAISANVQRCLKALAEEVAGQQTATADRLERLLTRQRWLILGSVAVTGVMLLVTLLLMVRPLVQAVQFVRGEKALPLNGSEELRFLAKTYNLMYEANREQKEKLAYDATHDRLTDVYNRNGYDFISKNTDWDTAALALFDLDKFKPINDVHGHAMGDRVLERTAHAIAAGFRPQDYVCRIGGDEFAVIVTRTGSGDAEEIRRRVAEINQSLAGEKNGVPAVRVSCGVAFGQLIKDYDKRFKEADAALYRAKNSGGGYCEVCL